MRSTLTAALVTAAVLAVSATAQAATGFITATSPNPGSNYNEIDAIAAVTASNAWAVGFQRSTGLPLWAAGYGTSSGTPQTATLIETTTG